MPKRKSEPVFLSVYVDKDGKSTFLPFRLEQVDGENDKGEKVKTIKPIAHETAKDKYGDDYIKPMNRAARRMKDRQIRLSEKRFGPRQVPKKEEVTNASNANRSEGNSSPLTGTETQSN